MPLFYLDQNQATDLNAISEANINEVEMFSLGNEVEMFSLGNM